MKLYEIVFSFLDPSRAVGTIEAETPEEAVEKLKEMINSNSPAIEDLTIESVTEVLAATPIEDLSSERTLN